MYNLYPLLLAFVASNIGWSILLCSLSKETDWRVMISLYPVCQILSVKSSVFVQFMILLVTLNTRFINLTWVRSVGENVNCFMILVMHGMNWINRHSSLADKSLKIVLLALYRKCSLYGWQYWSWDVLLDDWLLYDISSNNIG